MGWVGLGYSVWALVFGWEVMDNICLGYLVHYLPNVDARVLCSKRWKLEKDEDVMCDHLFHVLACPCHPAFLIGDDVDDDHAYHHDHRDLCGCDARGRPAPC